MIAAILIALLAIALIGNRQAEAEADLSSSANVGVWVLAIVCFAILLGAAAILGPLLSDPRILASLAGS